LIPPFQPLLITTDHSTSSELTLNTTATASPPSSEEELLMGERQQRMRQKMEAERNGVEDQFKADEFRRWNDMNGGGGGGGGNANYEIRNRADFSRFSADDHMGKSLHQFNVGRLQEHHGLGQNKHERGSFIPYPSFDVRKRKLYF
jgi:hypothetical protein